MRAAVYTRISDDRKGDRLGVQRQEKDCRELCAAREWEVVEVFEDDDRSAYSGRRRPAYERLLELLKDGAVDAVVAWHPDRLHRSPTELETFIDLIDATGAQVATCQAGSYDLTTAAGRMTARVVGATARYESELKSERTARKHLELAQAGKPVGGTRPFGLSADRSSLDEHEAALIRDAARAVLAGETLWTITRRWNEEGVKASRGGRWTQTAVRRILTNPTTAGLRAHKGEVVATATWPAILDRATWEQVRAVLDGRSGSVPGALTGRRPRRYLLTGFLWCGRCGERLIAAQGRLRARTYICPHNPAKEGCGGLRIVADPLEAEIVDQVLAVLVGPDLDERLAAQDHTDETGTLVARVELLERDLADAALDCYERHTISRAQLAAVTQRLEAERDAVRRRLARDRQRQVLEDARELTPETFDALSLDRRRTIIGAVADRVTIGRGTPGSNRFDPARAAVRWVV